MQLLLSVSSQPESCWTHSYIDDYDANSSCGLAVVHDSCPKIKAIQASTAQLGIKTVSPIIAIGYFYQGLNDLIDIQGRRAPPRHKSSRPDSRSGCPHMPLADPGFRSVFLRYFDLKVLVDISDGEYIRAR